MTTLVLGTLGLALSLVVPELLARARWTARAPGAAVVLWQALTLASVLSAVGVVLVGPEELVRAAGTGPDVEAWVLVGALAVAAVIVVRLLWSAAGVAVRSRRRRARHADLVDLLGRAEARADLQMPGAAPLRVLDGPLPLAYCLPGRAPRVVVSGAALAELPTDQVRAVLAHEQAHLRARHDLVLESFTAVYRAVPAPLRSRTSLDAVSLLLEMAADDAARARCGAAPLRAALAAMSTDGDLGADLPVPARPGRRAARDPRDDRRRRLDRLHADAPTGRLLRAGVLALAVAVLVLPTVFVVAPWLVEALPAVPAVPALPGLQDLPR